MGELSKEKIAEELLKVRFSQFIINEKNKNKEFKVPVHLAFGHEAIAVAVDAIMNESDQLVLSHRNIHYNLAREKSVKPEIDEYLLKKHGMAKGQLGSMNLANEEKGIVYTSSILGNNLPVAAGLSLAKKAIFDSGIVIVVTGDGAIEEGTFYETLVFAKSNNLPLLIIIENNGWSLATKIEERRCYINLKSIADSINIRYQNVDSNDVFEYIEILENLKNNIVSEKTPACIEVKLSTLGGWFVKEGDKERFINYHHGPAPKITLTENPVIENSSNDPVFILKKHIDKNYFFEKSKDILECLKKEIE